MTGVSPTPSERWGSLFAAVQESAIFPDSKTFADASNRFYQHYIAVKRVERALLVKARAGYVKAV